MVTDRPWWICRRLGSHCRACSSLLAATAVVVVVVVGGHGEPMWATSQTPDAPYGTYTNTNTSSNNNNNNNSGSAAAERP